MTLIVEQPYPNGLPQTAVLGFAPLGVGWHWTAGGTGRAGWDGSVAHLINTRLTVNASYHGGFWPEHKSGHVGCRTIIQWVVPTTKAAHSVAPASCWQYNANKSRTVQDLRFAEVRRILGAKSGDPNAGMIALAYAGMPADLERDLQCPVFRADVKNLADQLVAHPSTNLRPHFGHGWIQPLNRYEMDVSTNFIAMLYGEATTMPTGGDDMQFWKPVQQDWTTAVGTVFYDGDGTKKSFSIKTPIRSVAESSDGRWRLCKFGTESLVVDARGNDKEGPGLTPVSGSRIPASGFGWPPAPTAETVTVVKDASKEQIQEAFDDGTDAGVEAEQERLRILLGL